MKRITTILFAIAILLAAPAFFTSCQEDAPEINYTMNVSVINDFTKVVEAINNGFLKNEEAIKKLTESIDKMNADQQTKLQAITDVLNSVNATLETKLAAIEAAMQAQTLMLEAKLDLLEKAVNNQTIKIDEMGTLIATAIDKSRDELAKKLAAIYDIIESTAKTQAEKLAAIQGAIEAQTLSLAAKLGLLETAIKNQTLKMDEMGKLIATAIDNSRDELAKKLEAIYTIIESTAKTQAEKLAAIQGAIQAQTLSLETKLGLIEAAIKALPDYGDKLDAIAAAIKALPDYSDKFDAVVAALNAMKAQIEALGTGQASIVGAINNTTAAINALIAAVNSGNTSAAAALTQIIQKLEELKEKIGSGGGGSGGGGGGGSTEEYVDLGLPSGIKWAKRNLGASKPSDCGDYYAWGETMVKVNYTWATYKWMQAGQSDWKHITKYTFADGNTEGIWYDAGGNFIGDNKTTLEAADDAATAKLGSPWRMPTAVEIKELLDHCAWTWTKQDGRYGSEVKGPNGNSIFLPAAGIYLGSELIGVDNFGNYWPSSLSTHSYISRYIYFDSSGGHRWYDNDRCYGMTVRPVRP